jgi:hypothetical protein
MIFKNPLKSNHFKHLTCRTKSIQVRQNTVKYVRLVKGLPDYPFHVTTIYPNLAAKYSENILTANADLFPAIFLSDSSLICFISDSGK